MTDIALIRRKGRTALGVAALSIPLTFTSGLALGLWMPADLLVDADRRLLFALFLATALSIAAIPVLAKVLIELRVMRRNIGQTILAAAMIEDLVGWSLLGIVVGLADSGRLGGRSRCMPASAGVRPPFLRLQVTQQLTMFSQSFRPPWATGTTWSNVSSLMAN